MGSQVLLRDLGTLPKIQPPKPTGRKKTESVVLGGGAVVIECKWVGATKDLKASQIPSPSRSLAHEPSQAYLFRIGAKTVFFCCRIIEVKRFHLCNLAPRFHRKHHPNRCPQCRVLGSRSHSFRPHRSHQNCSCMPSGSCSPEFHQDRIRRRHRHLRHIRFSSCSRAMDTHMSHRRCSHRY